MAFKAKLYRRSLVLSAFCLAFGGVFSASGQTPIDVFFIAGQSNAGNIGEQNGVGTTDVGFNLNFGRIGDRPSVGNTAPGTVVDAYSSNLLDLNQNVNELALGLHDENDLGIYSFGRNGRPLANFTNDSDESWNPSANELYDQFVAWGTQRITELETAGFAPEVKGVFWFQGEGDVGAVLGGTDLQAVANYESNFSSLVSSFRQDFSAYGGDDLVVVGSELRGLADATRQALNDQVTVAVQNVAASDPRVGFVGTRDAAGNPLDDRFGNFNTDLHFSNASQSVIVDRWVNEYRDIVGISSGNSTGYVDTFEGDGVGVNPGTNGLLALTLSSTGNALFEDNGALTAGDITGSGVNRTAAYTVDAFDVANGFSLEVTYDIESLGSTNTPGVERPSNAATFGIVDSLSAGLDGLFVSDRELHGIGVSLTDRVTSGNMQGLNEHFALGDRANLADGTDQVITTGEGRTFELVVQADGSFTYSIDGATPTEGTTSIDLTRDYHFATYTQGSNGFAIQSVSFLPLTDDLACDFVDVGNGCDIDDLDALYAGTDGAPAFTAQAIADWLEAASGVNPAKDNPNDVYVIGDANLDGSVDSTDLGLLLNNFSEASGVAWGAGNFNIDGAVDSTDLGQLLNNFGFSSPASAATAVPEPGSLSLLVSALMVAFAFRRRR